MIEDIRKVVVQNSKAGCTYISIVRRIIEGRTRDPNLVSMLSITYSMGLLVSVLSE